MQKLPVFDVVNSFFRAGRVLVQQLNQFKHFVFVSKAVISQIADQRIAIGAGPVPQSLSILQNL